MFVMTENDRIINLKKYRSLAISEVDKKYRVVGYIDKMSGMQENDGDLDVIATFDNKATAIDVLYEINSRLGGNVIGDIIDSA